MVTTFIKGNYFKFDLSKIGIFDGIITDVPYKDALQGQLGEEYFDPILFMQKTYQETKPDAFLITFINFFGISHLINAARLVGWNFTNFQIWNKNKTSPVVLDNPTSRRHCEYIIFLTKGNYRFPDFPNAFVTFFGDSTTKVRPAEKPVQFSKWFKSIVGDVFILDPFCGSGNLIGSFSNAVCIDVLDYPLLKKMVVEEYLIFKQLHDKEKEWRKSWKEKRLSMIAKFEALEPNPFEQQKKIRGTKSVVKTLKDETKKRRGSNKAVGSIYQFVELSSPQPGLVSGMFIEKENGEIIPFDDDTIRIASNSELKTSRITRIRGKEARDFFKAKGLKFDPATGGFKPIPGLTKTKERFSKIELLKIRLPRMWNDWWKRAYALKYGNTTWPPIPPMPEDWNRGYLDPELSADENLRNLVDIATGSENRAKKKGKC